MTAIVRKACSGVQKHAAGVLILCALLMLAVAPASAKDFLIIAHRGASGYLPEHTREAKVAAYFSGADFIEQDVVLSKDGIPIVFHDLYLDAMTNVADMFADRARSDGRHYVIDFTLEELKQLAVGERIDLRSGDQAYPRRFPGTGPGFKIPTLEEEIQLIQGLNASTGRSIGLYPEIKAPHFHREEGQDLSKAVLVVLDKYGYSEPDAPLYLQSFDYNEIKRLRNELGYRGKLVQLLGENRWKIAPDVDYDYLKSPEGLRELAAIVDGIGPWFGQLADGFDSSGKPQDSGLTGTARDAGLAVHAYTLRADRLPDGVSDFDTLLKIAFSDLKLDGAFTDFPDRMADYRRQNAEKH